MIYLDNAASTHPKPPCVLKAVRDWLERNSSNPGRSGHQLSMAASQLIYETRISLGKLFGVERAEQIILAPGATYALNTVLLGLFNHGDHLITTDLEHNSVLRPLWHLQKSGVQVSVAKVDFDDDQKTIENILKLVRHNTRAIICTQCSNVCGRVLPIELIAERKPTGVLLIVDGSQGCGSRGIDVIKNNIDYYCAPSHKGLMGPQGGGFIIINNRIPRPLIYGGTGVESMNPEQPNYLPERLESGTLPTAICAGMKAAADYIDAIGIKRLELHKRALTDYAYEQLRGVQNIELYMAACARDCLGVIPFNLKGKDSSAVIEYFDQNKICARGGIHCAPLFHQRMGTVQRGMVRISFGWFNTEHEIDAMIKCLKKI